MNKPLHELSNIINSLFFTLEQVQSLKKIDDQDINSIINHCIKKKSRENNQKSNFHLEKR